jgi:hypothetical protein
MLGAGVVDLRCSVDTFVATSLHSMVNLALTPPFKATSNVATDLYQPSGTKEAHVLMNLLRGRPHGGWPYATHRCEQQVGEMKEQNNNTETRGIRICFVNTREPGSGQLDCSAWIHRRRCADPSM